MTGAKGFTVQAKGFTVQAKGFTLLEVILSMVLASSILAAVIMLNIPFITGFNEGVSFQRLRHKVSNPLEAVKNDVLGARTVYVDSSECYALCLIDQATGNRVYYYWSGNDLLRKSESVSTTLSCANGKAFAASMDKTNSGMERLKELTTIKLAATGSNNTIFRLWTTVLPTLVERTELFYDGFGCKSVNGKGWTLEDTGQIKWAIEASSGASGAYWLRQTLKQNQPSALISKAEVAVNLSRVNKAYLQFKYRTQGTLDTGEKLTVNFYDGTTWYEVFKDDLLGNISSLTTTTLNLDAYSLNQNNKIRFDGHLIKSSHHWVIDELSIIAK